MQHTKRPEIETSSQQPKPNTWLSLILFGTWRFVVGLVITMAIMCVLYIIVFGLFDNSANAAESQPVHEAQPWEKSHGDTPVEVIEVEVVDDTPKLRTTEEYHQEYVRTKGKLSQTVVDRVRRTTDKE